MPIFRTKQPKLKEKSKGSRKDWIKKKFQKVFSPSNRGRLVDTGKGTTLKLLNHKITELYFLVELKVKHSEHIPCSLSQYYVKIEYKNSPLQNERSKETSKTLATTTPTWNDTLKFLVQKEDWEKRNEVELECSLFCLNESEGTHSEKVTKVTTNLAALMNEHFIKFDTILVYVDVEMQRMSDARLKNRYHLCMEEQTFVRKRKKFVQQTMNNYLDPECISNVDIVPSIAIIGSGGGIRAVMGMCGALIALQEHSILDSAMYISGVSGSVWYLLALYANDSQLNPKAVSASIRQKLLNGNGIQFWKAWYKWKYYTKIKAFTSGKYFTLTDTFGEMIGDLLLGEKCKQKWSLQREKLATGCVPLPLLAALHVRGDESIFDYHEWIELSPYEALIPAYGFAIDMRNFGDKFYGGFLIQKYGEQPLHFIAGMCGSAFTAAKDTKPQENTWYMKIGFLNKLITSLYECFNKVCIAKIPNWLRGVSLETKDFSSETEYKKIKDTAQKEMMLVDAGIAFNSPYPLVLRRKVDIIISLDFSDRGDDQKWPFWEVVKAKKWAKENGMPFPDLNLKDKQPEIIHDKKVYKELYIFESPGKPTILHFVMVNNTFREIDKDQTNFDILPHYSTMEFYYSNEEFDKFKLLIEHNISLNKEKIVDCIKKTIIAKKRVDYENKIFIRKLFFSLFTPSHTKSRKHRLAADLQQREVFNRTKSQLEQLEHGLNRQNHDIRIITN